MNQVVWTACEIDQLRLGLVELSHRLEDDDDLDELKAVGQALNMAKSADEFERVTLCMERLEDIADLKWEIWEMEQELEESEVDTERENQIEDLYDELWLRDEMEVATVYYGEPDVGPSDDDVDEMDDGFGGNAAAVLWEVCE